MDKEKIHNAISDENVHFFLVATPELKRMIIANEHPFIKKLNKTTKTQLLEDLVLILEKDDIKAFVEGTLSAEGTFLFRTGEVRVVGTPSLKVEKTV
jgi:hypothetical protein